jgi:tripartite-type tricarboxylate transporter receptor subunit TctC
MRSRARPTCLLRLALWSVALGAAVSGAALGQVRSGAARMVGVAGAKRLTGDFADASALGEQGIDTGLSSWRAIVGTCFRRRA